MVGWVFITEAVEGHGERLQASPGNGGASLRGCYQIRSVRSDTRAPLICLAGADREHTITHPILGYSGSNQSPEEQVEHRVQGVFSGPCMGNGATRMKHFNSAIVISCCGEHMPKKILENHQSLSICQPHDFAFGCVFATATSG